MPSALKVLGQSALAAATLTDVYTVPAVTSAIVSSATVCNRAATATTFRLAIAVAGAANDNKQYVCYDETIEGNEFFTLTLGVTLAASDVFRAYAAAATVSVSLFGQEVS